MRVINRRKNCFIPVHDENLVSSGPRAAGTMACWARAEDPLARSVRTAERRMKNRIVTLCRQKRIEAANGGTFIRIIAPKKTKLRHTYTVRTNLGKRLS